MNSRDNIRIGRMVVAWMQYNQYTKNKETNLRLKKLLEARIIVQYMLPEIEE